MKIASWNVNSLNVRLPHLEQWLKEFGPDIVGIQETKLEDHKFPDSALIAAGYRSVFAGQKTYNGVALLSREPAQDVQIGIPGFEDEQKRVIAGTFGDLRVINLYVVNGQDIGTDKYEYKLRWLQAVHAWIAQELQRHPKLIVMGDFNIAPDARDVHDPEVWNENHILTSTSERGALNKLLQLGLHDGFRLHNDEAGVFSWWDYRAAGFRRNLGLRIDLTLVSDALKGSAVASGIDREPRTWERPSDHAPAWVELG
ncbi:exodeoxyribonuclease III [Stenotrophomonas maltophilia]|uniref:exodeoxyribonuclease III n=1 Tax=Stenotrophomonas TaxID=40323 RepID=UPI00201CE140|nr:MULTISPECIES: exodeoxyribonuclease III [Stenotrophomonas]MBN5027566.1 exodeoxyribonuclease III [Stenotrophomonas maltophilia]MDH1273959.1 exodeoxyribonuclease III [Stenotrophomonas sp. GD03937]MDH1484775.1 exodeoxyribonuclease III [Stenotrophomonas sp. GD03712]UQY94594.1 exodeoxyribonuclease III [Stenotrophomonas maltophilia]WON68707.1 exodeoxyribonuclease III [Stenotrophomonas maltophilia]